MIDRSLMNNNSVDIKYECQMNLSISGMVHFVFSPEMNEIEWELRWPSLSVLITMFMEESTNLLQNSDATSITNIISTNA